MSNWKIFGKPALLILHMQQGLIGNGSQSNAKIAQTARKSGVISNQQALLQTFRRKKLPVIYVNVNNTIPTGKNLPSYGSLWKSIRELKPLPQDIEVIPELTPQPGEPILTNWPLGAFNFSGLENILHIYGIDTVVPVGYATDGVVLSVIQGAADRYYSIILPSNASLSRFIKAHTTVMELIAPAIALVTTTEDIIGHLS